MMLLQILRAAVGLMPSRAWLATQTGCAQQHPLVHLAERRWRTPVGPWEHHFGAFPPISWYLRLWCEITRQEYWTHPWRSKWKIY
jgi:hypothetical protein